MRKYFTSKLVLVTALVTIMFSNGTLGCHALPIQNFAVTQVAGGVEISGASDAATCGCDNIYWMDIEVRCVGEPFDGAPFNPGFYGPLNSYPYFQSGQLNKPGCQETAYPTTLIPYTSMCPGIDYQIRVRENHNGDVGTWSTPIPFTVPGTVAPLSANINATTVNICAGDCTTLTANVVGGCGLAPIYTWSNGSNNQSINVCPGTTTTYSVDIFEQCSNLTSTASITVTVLPNPVSGTATISQNTICSGQTVDLALTGHDGNIQWQSSPGTGGPWTNIGGFTNANETTAALTNDICYRAVVTGCGPDAITNTVCVNVLPAGITALNCPGGLSAVCDISEQPPYATWTDFVNAGGSVTGDPTRVDQTTFNMVSEVSDGNTCPEIVTRTYEVTDDCGNTETCTQTITIEDTTPPVFATPPADVTVECVGDVPAMTNLNWTDNCDGSGAVAGTDGALNGGSCGGTITRTWTYTDACGNTATETQTITIEDTTPPVLAAPPADVTVECIGDVPAMTNLNWTDNCDGSGAVAGTDGALAGGNCGGTITRTWTYIDACGNAATETQTITIEDTTPPVLAAPPADVTVECIGDVPAMTNLNWTDNCDGSGAVAGTDGALAGGSCGGTITRTWTYTDACGNIATETQTITVNDNTAPTASNPATTTVECATDVPANDPTVVTDEADNCTAAPTVSFVSETSDNNVCNGEELTRVYQIEDDCGNTTTVAHTIIIDSYTPTFTVAGTDPTICTGTDGYITVSGLAPNTDYEFSYSGGAASVITTDGAGEYVINGLGSGTYTGFTVSDADCPACSTTDPATITLTDPNPPAIDAGVDQQVCEGNTVTLTADNPDGATISWDNGITDGTAFTPAVGTTTYTVTADLTGCVSTDQVDVTAAPTIDGITCPGGLTAVCDISEQPAYADFYAFIADGGSATIPAGGVIDTASFTLSSEVSDGLSCPETVTRTYEIADTCGVTVTCTQTIVINDIVAPTGTAPAPVSVQCIGDVPAADPTLITDEADNCTAPTVTHAGDATDGQSCPETITRTYRIEDACGNFIEVDQIITVDDDIDPTGTAPAPVTVQCIGDVPAADPTLITDEADNCTAAPTVTHVGDDSDNYTCPETITRTYRIEDGCGNFIEVDQTITVNDDIAPTASNPATTTVDCATDVPATDPTVVTDEADNCTVTPTVTFVSETSDNNVCNGEELTRVYEIEDDCGNTTTVTHTIIIDSYTPTFTVTGTDPTLCGANDGFITVTGLNPNEDYEISYNGNAVQTITADAGGEYVITGLTAGSYTDFTVAPSSCTLCEATDNTNINLVDPNAPPIDAGPDQTVCDGTQVTLNADNPNGANIQWNNGVDDGVPFTPTVGTTNYTVTAELAGCTSTDLLVVTVNPIPNVNAGNDVAVCDGEQVTLSGSGADSYAWDNGVSDGMSFVPTQTTTYTVTGTSIGCSSTDDVLVTVYDNPNVTFSADNTEGCIPQEVSFSNTTGPNSAACEWSIGGTVITDDCNPNYTFTNAGCFDISLTVTSTDGCSSTYTEQNYICIDDYPNAEFSPDPAELTSIFNETNFINGSSGAESYVWDFGDGNGSTETNPSHEYPGEEEDEFLVQLIAISQYGCEDTTYQTIFMREELLYHIPNTFTPDNDKFNETFKPVFTSGFDPQQYQLIIFDRWGEVLFESNNTDIGWDGTYGKESNTIVKDGTYVWKIVFKTKYKDERVVKIGHVNLLR